jgi:ribonuclease HI
LIGWKSTCSVLTTEIAAIAVALDYAQESFEQEPPKYPFEALRLRVTIVSDSQYALEAIRVGNGARSERASSPKDSRVFLRPRRARDRCRIQMGARTRRVCGNTEVDRAAREAASRDNILTAPPARRIREVVGVIRLVENDRKSDLTIFDSEGLPGQYTWKLNQALPGQHTLRL